MIVFMMQVEQTANRWMDIGGGNLIEDATDTLTLFKICCGCSALEHKFRLGGELVDEEGVRLGLRLL